MINYKRITLYIMFCSALVMFTFACFNISDPAIINETTHTKNVYNKYDGITATNHCTGAKLILKNGKWEKF